MQVELKVTRWEIGQDEKSKQPKVSGEYELLMAGNNIATQSFNSGYSDKAIPFSSELIIKLKAIEKDIVAEIEQLLT